MSEGRRKEEENKRRTEEELETQLWLVFALLELKEE
jgi:hypothetical protein